MTTMDIGVLAERYNELEKDVQAHDIFINGNGIPGVKARLLLIERDIVDIKSHLKGIENGIWVLASSGSIGIFIWMVNELLPRLIKILGTVK
jgi:hypothetical protein